MSLDRKPAAVSGEVADLTNYVQTETLANYVPKSDLVNNFDGASYWWDKYAVSWSAVNDGAADNLALTECPTTFSEISFESDGTMQLGGNASSTCKTGRYFYNGSYIYRCLGAFNDYYKQVSAQRLKAEPSKGAFTESVNNTESDAFPTDGYSNGNYYVAQGHLITPVKNTIRKTVLSSLVVLGKIDTTEFQTITGETYVAET